MKRRKKGKPSRGQKTMPIHSQNQRLALLGDVPAHIFWGFRSFLDFQNFHGEIIDDRVVIADKGFIDRSKTVYSINREWGLLGRFVINPGSYMLYIPPIPMTEGDRVLELGQDHKDFSWLADCAGYTPWLKQWPGRQFRMHPKAGSPRRSLEDDLALSGEVVGLNTSALVTASLAGHPVHAYGAHSMARGINECRVERLGWLKSIEWDRKDPTAAAAIAAALDDPGLAREAPQAKSRTPKARKGSRKKSAKTRPGGRARGKPGGQSEQGSDELDGDGNKRSGA